MEDKGAFLLIPSESGSISVWKDEVPADFVDVIDALRSVIAPLRTWKHCAVIYLWFFCMVVSFTLDLQNETDRVL